MEVLYKSNTLEIREILHKLLYANHGYQSDNNCYTSEDLFDLIKI